MIRTPSSDGSYDGQHTSVVVEGEEYELKPSPLGQYMEDRVHQTEELGDIERPKNVVDELNRMLYGFYKWCSPEPKEHAIRFGPTSIVVLWMIFLMTAISYGTSICGSDNTICTKAFIDLSWGGQYNRVINPQFWRLITAGFHHQSFLHIFTNCIIILCVSWMIESKYGSKRMWVIFLMSIFGGNILSWCVYPQETVIIGASSGCYGLFVFLIADCVLNWESVRYRWWILIYSLAFIAEIFIDQFAVQNVAVFAHVGGGIGSFCVSIMILPNFYYRPWEKYLTIVCAVLCFLQYVILPIVRWYIVFVE